MTLFSWKEQKDSTSQRHPQLLISTYKKGRERHETGISYSNKNRSQDYLCHEFLENAVEAKSLDNLICSNDEVVSRGCSAAVQYGEDVPR